MDDDFDFGDSGDDGGDFGDTGDGGGYDDPGDGGGDGDPATINRTIFNRTTMGKTTIRFRTTDDAAADYPNATEEDFTDDQGDWSADDYQRSAENLFGDHEFFGDDLITQRESEGFQYFDDPAFAQGFEEVAPGSTDTVRLFERDGGLSAFGFVTTAALALLQLRYTGLDLSNLEVTVPQKGEPAPPQPLPAEFAGVAEKDAVDLRRFCSPVGDQRQTSRCAAFAWTHAVETSRNLLNEESQRLSPTYSMLQFQRMQGDARDYRYAHEGGDGTVAGIEPGEVLARQGTCRQEYWPDDAEIADGSRARYGSGRAGRIGCRGRHGRSRSTTRRRR